MTINLRDLARRLEFGRPSNPASNPPGGVVYPDEADAWIKDVVLHFIDARTKLSTEGLGEREQNLLHAAEHVLARWAVARASEGKLESCSLSNAIKTLDLACDAYPDEQRSIPLPNSEQHHH